MKNILYVIIIATGMASCGGPGNERTPDSTGGADNVGNPSDNTSLEKGKAAPGDTTVGAAAAAGTSSGGAGTGASGATTGASSGTGSVGSDTSRPASGTDTSIMRAKKTKQKN